MTHNDTQQMTHNKWKCVSMKKNGLKRSYYAFSLFYFSQCVCLGIKRSTKLHISKSTPKGDLCFFFFFFFFLFKNYSDRLVWTTKLFSSICDITNCKSHLLKFDWLAGGENAWLRSARFKIETCAGVFISQYF